jgi:hypothetical protein
LKEKLQSKSGFLRQGQSLNGRRFRMIYLNVIRSCRTYTGSCFVKPAPAGETKLDAVSLKDSSRVKVLSLWDLSNCRETLAEQWIYRVCPMRAAQFYRRQALRTYLLGKH